MDSQQGKTRIAGLRFGPYVTPVVAIGVVVECEVRGLVTVVGVTHGPIPWPVGERDGEAQPIVFKALARAVRQEESAAVAAAWGFTTVQVEQWRDKCRQPRRRKKQTISSPPIPWKREDDELVRVLSLAEAARLTGRTLTAVRKRRRALGLPDGRMKTQRSIRTGDKTLEHAAQAKQLLQTRTRELSESVDQLRETFRKARETLSFWKFQSSLNKG